MNDFILNSPVSDTHQPKPVVSADALYFTDNGAVYCGAHLGQTAKYTGRDLSGQKIEKITAATLAQAEVIGFTPKCENCGRTA